MPLVTFGVNKSFAAATYMQALAVPQHSAWTSFPAVNTEKQAKARTCIAAANQLQPPGCCYDTQRSDSCTY